MTVRDCEMVGDSKVLTSSEALRIDWQVRKTETRLGMVLREQQDSPGAEALMVNRIFPIQIRYGVFISVLERNRTYGIYMISRRRFTMRDWLTQLWTKRFHDLLFCESEAPERWWWNSSPNPKA